MAGNSRNNIPAFSGAICSNFASGNTAFQCDQSIPLHIKAGFVPRRKRSVTQNLHTFGQIPFRQRADVDDRALGIRRQRLNLNVFARLDASAHVVDAFCNGHKDVVSGHHASANAG